MNPLQLDAATDRHLSDLAAVTGLAPAEIVREALADYAAEVAQAEAALQTRKRIARGKEGTVSLAEMERRLGLDG